MKVGPHPAWDREIRSRYRWERRARVAGLSLLAAMPVALGAFVAWRRGAVEILWSPAYVMPVVFLQVLVWGALWIRSRSGRLALDCSPDKLVLVRKSLASGPTQGVGARIVAAEVSSVALMARPEGRAILISRRDQGPWTVFLGRDGGGGLSDFLGRLPSGIDGLASAKQVLSAVLPADEYERLAHSEPDPGSRDFDRLLACHEALGCWDAASDQILTLAMAAGPTRDDLERLWKVERMRLPLAGLHGFLTGAAQVIPDVVVGDRLRLAMALGFRHEVAKILADAHGVEHLPASLDELPLDVWEQARKSGAPFRSGLLHSFVPQGHVHLSAGSLDLGGGRVLPLEFLVAVMARPGFVGVRSLVVFDIWGQRHEVPVRVLDRDADHWVAALRSLAPHVMELKEGPSASSRRSLALVRRLAVS